jgi:predicted lipid-binding transport protein (Tim44 family)
VASVRRERRPVPSTVQPPATNRVTAAISPDVAVMASKPQAANPTVAPAIPAAISPVPGVNDGLVTVVNVAPPPPAS